MNPSQSHSERGDRPPSVFLTFAIVVAGLVALFLTGILCLMAAAGLGLIPQG